MLKDLGVTQSPEGQPIIGAAILDDVLGLMVLAVVGGMVTAAAAGGPELLERPMNHVGHTTHGGHHGVEWRWYDS